MMYVRLAFTTIRCDSHRNMSVLTLFFICPCFALVLLTQFNPANVETDWQPSFFNLQIELLLEGLQGAETCDIYRFHVERGYGSQYFTQDEAAAAKAAYLAKSGREKRNLERQKARNLSKEEMDRLQELENKRQVRASLRAEVLGCWGVVPFCTIYGLLWWGTL